MEVRENFCFSNGLYCFNPPSDDVLALYPDIKEVDVLEENVRERCIYEVVRDRRNDNDEHMFFNYLYNFKVECVETRGRFGIHCSHRIMKEVGIKPEEVEICLQESFDTSEDWQSENKLLRSDRQHANELGVTQIPALAINSHLYRGEMDGDEIFQSICAAYKVGVAPEVCSDQYKVLESMGHIEDDFVKPFSLKHHHIIMVLAMVFLLNLVLLICCVTRKKRQEKSALQSSVQMHVEKYFELKDSDPTEKQERA